MTGRLDFFPDWRTGNPYLSMLFAGLGEVGVVARPVRSLVEHLASVEEYDDPGILNVHWTAPILAGARTAEETRARVDRLARLLDRFVTAGGRLVWSVHNVVPHDAAYPEAEVDVCRLLADRARLVHVLSEETVPAVAPYYPLDPARVVVIEHSSYLGVYPDHVDRDEARRRLALDADTGVLVTLGRIRPYKGIDRLLDAFERPPLDDPGLRLLVAGLQGGGEAMRVLASRLETTPRVVSHPRRVRRREMQVWMHSADLAVLPYTGILNSGSFLLAETFGLPVVAPRAGALVAREGRPHVRLFGTGDFEDVLASAVRDLVHDHDAAATARASALAAAAENPPAVMARRFAEVVAGLV